ncbi:MAG TPA: cytochrome b/b6 domain-containing protein [Burkholderiales bacterium]|nr:cytochrome b/b6 domain-containing protein [Burkholderiales bacterium]
MKQEPLLAVKVWDLPVRLVHWALLVLVAFQIVSAKVGGRLIEWHLISGYCVLVLVLFRVLWGFAGSSSARFGGFLAPPREALRFASRLLSRRAQAYAGHNPLGGWMVLALLVSLLVQVGTGLFANDGIATEGPLAALISIELSDRLTTLHRWNLGILLVLIAVHTAAALYHWLALKENLIGAMFTGVKRLQAARVQTPIAFAGLWRALLLFLIALAAVWLLVTRLTAG